MGAADAWLASLQAQLSRPIELGATAGYLRDYGSLNAAQLARVGVADPGAFGGLVEETRIGVADFTDLQAGDGSLDWWKLRSAATQLGIDPQPYLDAIDPQGLLAAVNAANRTGRYLLTEDASQLGDAQTRARHAYRLQGSTLVPEGNLQVLDLRESSGWRDFVSSGFLQAIAFIGAAAFGGQALANAAGAGTASTVTAADIASAVGSPELGLVANGATAQTAIAGGINSSAFGATAAATASLAPSAASIVDAVGVPELGLVANDATMLTATSQGIPAAAFGANATWSAFAAPTAVDSAIGAARAASSVPGGSAGVPAAASSLLPGGASSLLPLAQRAIAAATTPSSSSSSAPLRLSTAGLSGASPLLILGAVVGLLLLSRG